ncbi:MAG: right-handed parallel beta-helix repeat-containing protein, partial [Burkholderiales bacterium]|nr:right-handed parallel beta-helix repeat-containing protein [Burkholderiales bacterium]
ADGKSAEGKAIWVIKGNFTTVENIAFENAAVRDRNGAGIRLEGRDLMVSRCLFRKNQNGILTGENPESSVYILDSEFDHNGAGDGFSHNLYVGGVKKLVVRRCYLHGAVVGHDLKSRAYESVVTDNRIADDGGESSYEADFPNGGKVLLAFNVIQQGERAQNYTMVAYGEEGMRPSGNSFVAKGNTFLNQHELGGVFIRLAKGNIDTNLIGNVFYGNGLLPDIPGIREHNDFTMNLPGNANWRPNSRQN